MKKQLLELLWPRVCPFCEKVHAKGICEECKKTLKRLRVNEPYCMKCGKPIHNEEAAFCKDCSTSKRYFNQGMALWRHQGIVSKAIYNFKYYNQRAYGDDIARRMAIEAGTIIKRWNPQVIIPVPLCKKRRRIRGFNQSLILANRLGEELGIPVKECVSRIKETLPQNTLDKTKRKSNITGAFAIESMPYLKRVLIVDDIFTSGSTIDEISRLLKNSGVSQVYFITISIGQEY